MLLSSATGRRNSTVHVSNNTNKYKNRQYQVPYRTSYPVQSYCYCYCCRIRTGYLSVVTFLQYIFILETLDSSISLEGINLPPTCPKGRHQAAAVLETCSMAKKYDHDVLRDEPPDHNRSGPGTRFPWRCTYMDRWTLGPWFHTHAHHLTGKGSRYRSRRYSFVSVRRSARLFANSW